VIFSLFLIAMWSPVLAALAGGFGLLQVGVAAWAGRRLWIGVEREVAADAETRACLMEMWRGLSDLKTAGREAYAIERWSGFAARGLEMSEARQRFGLMVETLGSGMAWCSLLGLLVLGAHEVMAGGLTMAAMLALIVLAAGALMPLGEVSRSLQRFLIARARFETLRDVLDAADVSEVPATRADERVAPEMLMRGDRQREGWR
jgi:ABC-type bacteriocin/lantibiotic exporter with double-glycine peptidase domain